MTRRPGVLEPHGVRSLLGPVPMRRRPKRPGVATDWRNGGRSRPANHRSGFPSPVDPLGAGSSAHLAGANVGMLGDQQIPLVEALPAEILSVNVGMAAPARHDQIGYELTSGR